MQTAHVRIKPLHLTYGIKVVGEGTFKQKYSRDDNAYYPGYSAIKPLVLTIPVSVQDPDGIMPAGPVTLTRIDWYLKELKASNKITTGADYEITTLNGIHVLKIKRNTPVSAPYDLIGVACFTNPKTGVEESVEATETLSTQYYESTLLSLRAASNPETIINPMKITGESGWLVPVSAKLKSGETDVDPKNAAYWWYVQDGQYTRKVGTSDTWAVTKPDANGTYPDTLVVDTSRITSLKLICRAAYYGEGEPVPSSPVNASLSVAYNLMVRLPVLNKAEEIKEKGYHLEPKDFGTDKEIVTRCEITAGGSIVQNPDKYYNITWKAVWNNEETIIGYGERNTTTVKQLGITYLKRVYLKAVVTPKVGYFDIEGSVYNGLGATPVLQYGVNQIADKLGAYLVSCPDGINPVIIGKLKNNNWNRFEDGSLAPTTVNSAAEDKGYNIMYGWTQTIHTIENAIVGDETVALFSENPFEYNGVQSRAIPPTLICPGLPALVNGKFRSMYFKYRAGEGGSDGLLNITYLNKKNRTYPKTGLSQLTTNDYAVAHNADNTKTLPFAPLMDWHLLNITNALMNKFGTVYLHDPNKFGGGISSNIAINSGNYNKTTGVMYRVLASDPWIYQKLSETPSFCVDASGTKKTWNEIVSNHYPRMECMEIQMVLSYAAENNIQPATNFSYEGYSYVYHDIPNTKTLLEGEMNALLSKKTFLHDQISAFDTSGNPIAIADINLNFQTSAVYGMDLVSADVFQFAGAGMERVAAITDAAQGNNANNKVKNFIMIDQSKLCLDKKSKVLEGELFDFEKKGYVWSVSNYMQAGYHANLYRGTRIGLTMKGGIADNTAYNDNANYSSGVVGERIRMGVRVRGSGSYGVCSARYVYSSAPLSYTSATCAGGFQVRLPEGAASASDASPQS